jgi:hypothetical protein
VQARTFSDPDAFRQSLDERLNQIAETEGITVNELRLKLLMERLLARLFAGSEPAWLLKGGYAMELRFHPRARTTTDLDLSFTVPVRAASTLDSIKDVRERLQKAAALELGDHLVYRIGDARLIQATPGGGARFPVVVMLAAREYGRFHVDVGLGPAPEGQPERLIGSDFLAFAGVPPAAALSIAREVQFAEKIHAYTRPWGDWLPEHDSRLETSLRPTNGSPTSGSRTSLGPRRPEPQKWPYIFPLFSRLHQARRRRAVHHSTITQSPGLTVRVISRREPKSPPSSVRTRRLRGASSYS